MIENIKEFSTLLGTSLIIIVSGICWAKNQLAKEFVTHLQHQQKEKEIREYFSKEINKRYKELQVQIEKNHEENIEEVKRLREKYDKNKEILIRLETKMDLLIDDKIKKD